MELTPNEMRNQTFAKSFRGYAPTEVDSFRDAAATALEEARVKILKMTEEYQSLKQRFQELKNLEETIKIAVLEAQKNSEQIVANARKEAELIIDQAKHRRDKMIEEKHQRLAELDAQIEKLEFTRKSFYNKLRAEMQAHLKLVDSIYPEDTASDQRPQRQVSRPRQTAAPAQPPESQPVEAVSEELHTADDEQDESPMTSEFPVDDEYDEQTPTDQIRVEEPVKDPMQTAQIPVAQQPLEHAPMPDTPVDAPKPAEPPKSEVPREPKLELNDNDIDRLVDGFGETTEDVEEVKNGQSQGDNF
ncbi:MAG: DivIVA domain-containing protein [candidate division Zixibacteria bacterium]|nr:DivIVA domain-containing protein [candidate division Zixibacteria bacterium]